MKQKFRDSGTKLLPSSGQRFLLKIGGGMTTEPFVVYPPHTDHGTKNQRPTLFATEIRYDACS